MPGQACRPMLLQPEAPCPITLSEQALSERQAHRGAATLPNSIAMENRTELHRVSQAGVLSTWAAGRGANRNAD